MSFLRNVRWLWALIVTATPALAGEPIADADRDFFENKIRPVLVAHCFECHSADSKPIQGGLRLDTSSGLVKGGDTGSAVDNDQPNDSLLLQALRYDGLEMPPAGKLPEDVINDFKEWVSRGAPDPREDADPSNEPAPHLPADKHWAFQPPTPPAVPDVSADAWSQTPIDRFLLAKLNEAGIAPSPTVSRRTLLRRLSIDLVGLPPEERDVEEFEADASPDAVDRVVDRLLASPRHAERWARHWLDVARYADTKDGVLMYGDDRIRPYAYTYRDYVIHALNENTPFSRFILEQIAGDQLNPPLPGERLAAMGFLTLGRLYDNNLPDQIDDKIDTVTRGFLGLTVSCARCHDHKYEPIAQQDYYALYGVFSNSESPLELPAAATPTNPEAEAIESQLAAKRAEIVTFIDQQYAALIDEARARIPDYLIRAATTKPDLQETAIFFLSLQPTDLRPPIVARWRRLIDRRANPDDPIFSLWEALRRIEPADFAAAAPGVIEEWSRRPTGTEPGQANPILVEALAKITPTSWEEVARAFGDAILTAWKEAQEAPPVVAGTSSGASADSLNRQAARDQLVALVNGPDAPGLFPRSRVREFLSREPKDALGGKYGELDRMAVKSPDAVPRAMSLVDSPEIAEPRLFLRGNPSAPGEVVPRRFLPCLSQESPRPLDHGSGRLDLAEAIADPANPLTYRVLANRIWMHHFGEPLVGSPSDFGVRTPAPVQQELLDYLATEMASPDSAWKSLHRLLVTSHAYAQASVDRPAAREVDHDNRLWWRADRRRIDLETMRDSMLQIAHRLDGAMFGRPVDVASQPDNQRRTVYGVVDRQSLPGMFRNFDFASPDQSAERRPNTTVPQQALFAMNSAFVKLQAEALAADPDLKQLGSIDAQVRSLYRRVLLREPRPDELAESVAFAQEVSSDGDPLPWIAQALLMSNEFMFVD